MSKVKVVIGIAANRPEAGKSTLLQVLTQEFKTRGLRVKRFAFACPIKQATALLISEATGDPVNTVLRRMSEASYKNSMASPAHVFGGKTVRQLLQLMGTEFGREMVNRDIWLNTLICKLTRTADDYDVALIDDMRMRNEYERLTQLAHDNDYRFVPVYIHRPYEDGARVETHASEGNLDYLRHHYVSVTLDNTGTLADYKATIYSQLDRLCGIERG